MYFTCTIYDIVLPNKYLHLRTETLSLFALLSVSVDVNFHLLTVKWLSGYTNVLPPPHILISLEKTFMNNPTSSNAHVPVNNSMSQKRSKY